MLYLLLIQNNKLSEKGLDIIQAEIFLSPHIFHKQYLCSAHIKKNSWHFHHPTVLAKILLLSNIPLCPLMLYVVQQSNKM